MTDAWEGMPSLACTGEIEFLSVKLRQTDSHLFQVGEGGGEGHGIGKGQFYN